MVPISKKIKKLGKTKPTKYHSDFAHKKQRCFCIKKQQDMIKFFRTTRQRLVTTNASAEVKQAGKYSRYLVYAIGEIILVVIGILIALQVNIWNQERVNTGKQSDYLIGLKNDLEAQILLFDSSDRFCDFMIGAGESILTDYKSLEKFSEIDSINKRLTSLMFARSYAEIRATYNELSSTGQVNLIRDKSLRSAIVKYYLVSEFYKESIDNNIEHVIYSQIFPIIKSTIIIQSENFNFEGINLDVTDNLEETFENNLNNSSKEFELLNAISLRIIITKSDKEIYAEARNEAENLLSLINNELEMN